MKLVRIENNWDERALAIDLSIGNVCNYKCWYCFPGSNEGNHKFPDYEIFKNNITHLLNYYKDYFDQMVLCVIDDLSLVYEGVYNQYLKYMILIAQ